MAKREQFTKSMNPVIVVSKTPLTLCLARLGSIPSFVVVFPLWDDSSDSRCPSVSARFVNQKEVHESTNIVGYTREEPLPDSLKKQGPTLP